MQLLPSSQVTTGEQRRVDLFRGWWVLGWGRWELPPSNGCSEQNRNSSSLGLRSSNSCAPLCLVAQSHPTLCDPMGCSPPARLLEWVAIPFSRGSSWPRDRIWVSCIAGGLFAIWATREAPLVSPKWHDIVLFLFADNIAWMWKLYFKKKKNEGCLQNSFPSRSWAWEKNDISWDRPRGKSGGSLIYLAGVKGQAKASLAGERICLQLAWPSLLQPSSIAAGVKKAPEKVKWRIALNSEADSFHAVGPQLPPSLNFVFFWFTSHSQAFLSLVSSSVSIMSQSFPALLNPNYTSRGNPFSPNWLWPTEVKGMASGHSEFTVTLHVPPLPSCNVGNK